MKVYQLVGHKNNTYGRVNRGNFYVAWLVYNETVVYNMYRREPYELLSSIRVSYDLIYSEETLNKWLKRVEERYRYKKNPDGLVVYDPQTAIRYKPNLGMGRTVAPDTTKVEKVKLLEVVGSKREYVSHSFGEWLLDRIRYIKWRWGTRDDLDIV